MVLWPSFWVALLGGTLVRDRLSLDRRLALVGLVSWLFLFLAQPGPTLAVSAFATFAWFLPDRSQRVGWRRQLLRAMIVGLLLQLVIWKYLPAQPTGVLGRFGFLGGGVPLGASYVTFKLIHAAMEISRGGLKGRTPVSYFTWVFLLPTYSAGPIERYDHFQKGLVRESTWDDVVVGLLRIAVGLIKKFVLVEIVLAALLQSFQPQMFVENLTHIRTVTAWYVCILWFLYEYLDFSAYSDIALGASRLLGFRIMENFNFPFLATSIGEFWKRWHMSLAAFCQTYIYLPAIGATRRPTLATYLTFVGMGLWHAATPNWILWGLWHATGVIGYATLYRRARTSRWFAHPLTSVAGWGVTMLWVLIGTAWVIPATPAGSLRIIGKLFGLL